MRGSLAYSLMMIGLGVLLLTALVWEVVVQQRLGEERSQTEQVGWWVVLFIVPLLLLVLVQWQRKGWLFLVVEGYGFVIAFLGISRFVVGQGCCRVLATLLSGIATVAALGVIVSAALARKEIRRVARNR